MAATVDLIVSRIGPKLFSSNSNIKIEPICDTKYSTVAATEIEKKIKSEMYSRAG